MDQNTIPGTPLSVVSEAKVADRVAALLLRQISSGIFKPGERLPGERTLAESLGVSRVSVRAALQRLKARGLVSAVQGGGTRVESSVGDLQTPLAEMMKVDRTNLEHLAEIRVGLEVWAAGRAALSRTEGDLARIDRVLAKMEDGERTHSYKADDDLEFHRSIADAAHSPVYRHLFEVIQETVFNMLEYHRYVLFHRDEDDATVLEQHRSIARAIRNQDQKAAEATMQAHLTWVLSNYRNADSDLPPKLS